MTAIAGLFALLLLGASLPPAMAATTYNDSVQGNEIFFTSTEGVFTGSASGDLPGKWVADVLHEPLGGASAAITGGSFLLSTTVDATDALVVGSFVSGSVVQQSGFTGCTNQAYAVSGVLADVGVHGSDLEGSGTFNVVLTHYRVSLFGHCVAYKATVVGSISLNF